MDGRDDTGRLARRASNDDIGFSTLSLIGPDVVMLRNAREEARELITAPCTEFDELGGNERSCVVQAFRVAADAREEVENPKTSSASRLALAIRSEEHTSELQSLMRISYAVFCLKKKKKKNAKTEHH